MINQIRVRNLALIEEATMEFGSGLTVLTGETGAGKSALLGAIKLAIGARGDTNSIRDGQREAVVEAEFTVDESTASDMEERGFELDGSNALVKRVVSADGHSRCYVNDGQATVKGLSQTIGSLVSIHGQHDSQTLISPQSHLEFLDKWGFERIDAPKNEYAKALGAYREASRKLDDAREFSKTSKYQLDQARYVCSQIGAVNPGKDEYEKLEAELPILRNGEALASSAYDALQAIRNDGCILDLMGEAQRSLEHAHGMDPRLDDLARRLEEHVLDLEDIAMELREYRDDVEFDPEALQEALDRLGQLDGLVRNFGPTYEDMLTQWEDAKELLENSEDSGGKIERLEKECDQTRLALEKAAAKLADARSAVASEFCPALSSNVSELAMAGAVFQMKSDDLEISQWTMSGSKRYELMYAPASSMTPRPLSKIASGGELSRIMLALECMVDSGHYEKTLIFDEVDAGIGGTTAQAVARRLSELAEKHQVIVVTHLAQIAAVAQCHLLVEKSGDGNVAKTTIRRIDGDDRVGEIARMLSGSTDDAAIRHARVLLAG